uniref:SET domain-containing protein n=1 Tax=Magallana gigas TaxID=29159 RepID=A0A8W8NXV7_MAGGI
MLKSFVDQNQCKGRTSTGLVASSEYDAKKEAEEFVREKKDKKCLRVRHIDDVIGKGVFALRDFSKGEFLLEYAGELLRFAEGRKRMKDYPLNLGSFIYLFSFKDKQFWVDGTYSKQKGKYVNDAAPKSKQNNSVMKILEVDGVPHLVLYASRKICKGEEIRYDYGEKNLPWRKKETKRDEIPKETKWKFNTLH